MCVVSMILDHGRQRYPAPSLIPWNPQPYPMPGIIDNPTQPPNQEKNFKELIDELYKLIDQAKKYDEAAGEPDCEDPEKEKWLDEVKEIRNRMKEYIVTVPNGTVKVIANTWEVQSNGTLVFWQDESRKMTAAIFAPGKWDSVEANETNERFLQD